MKVLFLDTGRELRLAQRQLLMLVSRLAEMGGITPIVAAHQRSVLYKKAREAGLQTFDLPSGRNFDPYTVYTVWKYLRRNNIRIVQTNDSSAASLGALLKVIPGNDISLVHVKRTTSPLGKAWKEKRYLMGDIVVGVNHLVENRLKISGIPKERIRLVHSAVNLDYYRHKRKKDDGDVFILGIVGSLNARNNQPEFIEALRFLEDPQWILPEWEAWIVGVGPLDKRLKKITLKYRLDDRIRFFGFQEGYESIPEFDILVVASSEPEFASERIREGFAAGVPVIAADIDSNRELIEDGVEGRLFEEDCPQDLAKTMIDLMMDSALRISISENALKKVHRFSDVIQAEKYMDIYFTLSG